IWSSDHKPELKLILWDLDVIPGVGSDAQDHISDQVGDYDILLGFMWNRIGTATPRAASGTVEEFERAIARFRADPDSIRILMYFCNADIPRDALDLEQYTQLEDFKARLRDEEGVLYGSYGELDELEQLLRLHLSKLVFTWGTEWGIGARSVERLGQQEDGRATVEEQEADEAGLLDVVDEGNAQFNSMNEGLELMKQAVEDLVTNLKKRTAEMGRVPDPSAGRPYLTAAKMVTQRTSMNLQSFCSRIDVELPRFREALANGIDSMVKAHVLMAEFGAAAGISEKALQSSKALREAMAGAIVPVREFRDTVLGWPPVSTALNRAKRRTLTSMDQLISELERGIGLLEEFERALS
ncbi:unnamed protein product, partial [marine sediment metagenome]